MVGPGPDAVAVPDRETLVLYHRETNPETQGRGLYLIERLLPKKFRRVNADNRQSGLCKLFMPSAQIENVSIPALIWTRPTLDDRSMYLGAVAK